MMPPDRQNKAQRTRELMMRALDDEISDPDSKELHLALEADAALRSEWDSLLNMKKTTANFALARPPDELWEGYMDSVYRRVERGIGWILMSVGAFVLLTYGIWQLVEEVLGDVSMPWYVKGGALALLAGIVIVAVSVAREKFFVFKDDPYRNVDR